MRDEFQITRQGKQYVLFAGLLDEAHRQGLNSIDTELIQIPTEANGNVAICKATVVMDIEDGATGEPLPQARFSGIGDASPSNVGRSIAPHLIRMAETRAKARALRDAVNVGATAFEELGDSEGQDEQPRPVQRDSGPSQDERTRGGATRKAAGKLWHMVGGNEGAGAWEKQNGEIQDMDARTVSNWINQLS